MRMELSDSANTFALQLLDRFDSHISVKFLWESIKEGLPFYIGQGDKPFSALHCSSYFGIAEVTNSLINTKTPNCYITMICEEKKIKKKKIKNLTREQCYRGEEK